MPDGVPVKSPPAYRAPPITATAWTAVLNLGTSADQEHWAGSHSATRFAAAPRALVNVPAAISFEPYWASDKTSPPDMPAPSACHTLPSHRPSDDSDTAPALLK